MKRKLFFTLVVWTVSLLGAIGAWADNYRLYIEDFSIEAGATKTVSVLLDNGTKGFTGFETSIYLPEGLTLVETFDEDEEMNMAFYLNADRKKSKHDMMYAKQSDGSYKLLAGGNGVQTYGGTSGTELFNFSVTAAPDFSGTATIRIEKTLFTDVNLDGFDFPDETCTVTGPAPVDPDEPAYRLHIEDFSIEAGATKTVSVLLDNGTKGFTGFETSIYLPEGLTLVETFDEDEEMNMAFYLNADRKKSKHDMMYAQQPDGYYKLLAGGNGVQTYGGTSGTELFNFSVTAAPDFSGTATIRIANTLFTDVNLDGFDFPDETCTVTINRVVVEYTITATSANTSQGTVTGGGTYTHGASVTLTATPADGYEFVQWSDGTTANPYTFTATADKSVTAQFQAKSYTITVTTFGTNHIIDLSTGKPVENLNVFENLDVDGLVTSPEQITSNAAETTEGPIENLVDGDFGTFFHSAWSADADGQIEKIEVEDPETGEITEVYPEHNLMLDLNGSYQQLTFKWFTRHDNNTINGRPVDVTIFASNDGENWTEICKDTFFYYGTKVVVAGEQKNSYVGVLSVDLGAKYGHVRIDVKNDGMNIGRYGRWMNASEFRVYEGLQYEYKYDEGNSPGTVSGGGTYTRGTSVTLTATPADGYEFLWWSNGTTANPYTFTATANMSVMAQFQTKSYTITATSADAEQGTVTGGGSYTHGATVTLTATPADGYEFVKWSGGTTANPYTFIATANKSVTAQFRVVGLLGDVNLDTKITAADMVGAVNFILNTNTTGLSRASADVNRDGDVTVSDATGIVNLALGLPLSANSNQRRVLAADTEARLAIDAFRLTPGADEFVPVALCAEADEFTALQFDVLLPEGIHLTDVLCDDDHMAAFAQQTDGKMRIVVLSPDNVPFAGNGLEALTLQLAADADAAPGTIAVDAIEVARPDMSRVIPAAFSAAFGFAGPTGIDSVGNSDHSPLYDIQGRRTAGAAHGIYVTQGRKVVK